MGKSLTTFTEAASIMGLSVVGALIASSVKMTTALNFKVGEVSLALQTDVLDRIMPSLLPVLLTALVYKLLGNKKWTATKTDPSDYCYCTGMLFLWNPHSIAGKEIISMKRILVTVSHHKMADGLKDTLNLFQAECRRRLHSLPIWINQPVEEAVDELMKGFAEEDEVIVLTDLTSGSVNQQFSVIATDRIRTL